MTLSVWQQRWRGITRSVVDASERQRIRTLLGSAAPRQGPPRWLRPVIRLMGLDYDAEVRRLDEPALDLPAVAITRASDASG